MIKIGSTVETPHGVGKIVKEEVFRTCERWGVELHNNPFTLPIAYYFKNEIKELDKRQIPCKVCNSLDYCRFDGHRNVCGKCEIDE